MWSAAVAATTRLSVSAARTSWGESGNDAMFAGNGDDTVLGGAGDDGIDVSGDQSSGFQDEVFCGPGEDVVFRDENDLFATALDGAQECERVRVAP